jgi:hypothetical protein
MDHLMSSATLLLTVIGILFGVWYPEIAKILEEEIPRFREDRQDIRRRVKLVLNTKAYPLTISALLLALIFLPDSLKLCSVSAKALRALGWRAYWEKYDAISTTFVVANGMMFLFAVLMVYLTVRLVKKLKEIQSEKAR